MPLLEVCCFSPESAILAYQSGADRIELCTTREAGGTTPPREWLVHIKQNVTIPIFVMIRPRGGDFNYSPREFDQMGATIDQFKPDADGFVFGILDPGGRVDINRTKELVERAHPWPCTFHRAFDETPHPLEALQDVISTGCSSLLTSGGTPSAPVGAEIIAELVGKAQDRLAVMPGGGVRSENLTALQMRTQAPAFHSSCVLAGRDQPDTNEIRLMKEILACRGKMP